MLRLSGATRFDQTTGGVLHPITDETLLYVLEGDAAGLRPLGAAACQTPPGPDPDPHCNLQAELVVGTDLVRGGEPFDVLVTITNSPPVAAT